MGICRWLKKLSGQIVLQENGVDVPTVNEVAPEPPPPIVIVKPKIFDKGLSPDKVTSDYGLRLLVDSQAKYDELMKDSNGWLRFQNHGGLWLKNIPKVRINRLDAENCWVMLIDNCADVVIDNYEGHRLKVGPQLNGSGVVNFGKVLSTYNYRPYQTGQPQGDGIIVNSRSITCNIKKLDTEGNGDCGLDWKGNGVVDEFYSTGDGNPIKAWGNLTVKQFYIKDSGRIHNTRGEGAQSRAEGENAKLILGSGTIDNCLKPEQSIKASVVTSGKTAITEITGQVKVIRPSGYTGNIFMTVNNGSQIIGKDKVTIV